MESRQTERPRRVRRFRGLPSQQRLTRKTALTRSCWCYRCEINQDTTNTTERGSRRGSLIFVEQSSKRIGTTQPHWVIIDTSKQPRFVKEHLLYMPRSEATYQMFWKSLVLVRLGYDKKNCKRAGATRPNHNGAMEITRSLGPIRSRSYPLAAS